MHVPISEWPSLRGSATSNSPWIGEDVHSYQHLLRLEAYSHQFLPESLRWSDHTSDCRLNTSRKETQEHERDTRSTHEIGRKRARNHRQALECHGLRK